MLYISMMPRARSLVQDRAQIEQLEKAVALYQRLVPVGSIYLFGNPFRTAEPLERSVDGSVRQCATYASGCQFSSAIGGGRE